MIRSRNAFTLVELLIVIAIISILIGLLFPAVQSIRESARKVQCQNQVRQLSLASISFESSKGFLPSPFFDAHPNHEYYSADRGMFINLLPYIERRELADLLPIDRPIASEENQEFISYPIPPLNCPSSPESVKLTNIANRFGEDSNNDTQTYTCDYTGNGGVNGRTGGHVAGPFGIFVEGHTQRIHLTDIRSGLSNTFAYWESSSAILKFPSSDVWVNVDSDPPDSFAYQFSDPRVPPLVSLGQASTKSYFYSWIGIRVGTIKFYGSKGINVANNELQPFSFHPGGAVFSRLDGSVHFENENIDLVILEQLGAR